jgi:hypothetical protein
MKYTVVGLAAGVLLDFAERRVCWQVIGIAGMEI